MESYSALPQSPKLQSSHYKVMLTWEPTPKLNCSITPWKNINSELLSNSSYVHDVIETSNEVLAGLKMMFTFLSRPKYPPVLLFSDKSQTAIFLILLSKNITKIFLESFGWRYFAKCVIKPQIYVKLCLKTELLYFYKRCGKKWQYFGEMTFGPDRVYNY